MEPGVKRRTLLSFPDCHIDLFAFYRVKLACILYPSTDSPENGIVMLTESLLLYRERWQQTSFMGLSPAERQKLTNHFLLSL